MYSVKQPCECTLFMEEETSHRWMSDYDSVVLLVDSHLRLFALC
jgi:hypothetical protein